MLAASAPSAAPSASCARRSCICRKSAALLRDSPHRSSGAQDVCAEAQGAFTGEVSAAMLQGRRLQVRDRRPFRAARCCIGESDSAGRAQIRRRAVAGTDADPVRGRAAGRPRGRPHRRSRRAPARCGARALRRARRWRRRSIAYEPVWAIGTGRNATPAAGAGSARLHPRADRGRAMLESPPHCASCTAAASRPAMRAELFAMPDVDGGLIGGASLKADEFLAILAAARERRPGMNWLQHVAHALLMILQVFSALSHRRPRAAAARQGRGCGRGLRRGRIRHGVRCARRAHRAVARDGDFRRDVHDQQPRARVHGQRTSSAEQPKTMLDKRPRRHRRARQATPTARRRAATAPAPANARRLRRSPPLSADGSPRREVTACGIASSLHADVVELVDTLA